LGQQSLHRAEFFEFIVFSRKGSMAIGLRVEDRLDGAANFGAWKERMILLL
jgi:hypothetical protein